MAPAIAAIAILAAAVTALLLTSPDAKEEAATPKARATPPPTQTSTALVGAYGRELGADGQYGRWLGDRATFALRRSRAPERWLAFRASSYRRTRRMRLTSKGGMAFKTVVPREPGARLIGPIKSPTQSLTIAVAPRATAGPGDDRRRLSVFISALHETHQPLAALPGKGFLPEEESPRDVRRFNWLSQDGDVDIVAGPRQPRAYLAFDARSSRTRWLTIRAGSDPARRVNVPGSGSDTHVVVGPFTLRRGHARIRFHATPGPDRGSGKDPRRLSVRLADLKASNSAAGL
ncbi:MAG: hypothetical protein M3350_10900 [Actinomycetota bacterium]|nr:hypothetical protein [Actinomycetota bacterium]